MSSERSSPLSDLVTVFVSYKEAPLDRVGSLNNKIDYLYRTVRSKGLVVLSTCNRFEVYMDSPVNIEHVKEIIETHAGIASVLRGEQAALRLLRIAAGLESAILGDYEIMAQIRKAMNIAYQKGRLSRLLDVLFRSALMTGKRVRTETEISRGGIGYPYAAVVLVEKKLGKIPEKVMIYGTGKAARRILALLCDKVQEIYIVSRMLERARRYSKICRKAKPMAYSDLSSRSKVDAVFIAVSKYTIPTHMIRNASIIVDLSVPPVIEKVDERFFRLEDLTSIIENNIKSREKWVPLAEKIISEEFESLRSKLLEERVSFIIRKIIKYNENILKTTGYNGNLELLEKFSSKLLHPLFVSLRQASREANSFDDFLRILDKSYG